MWKSCAQSEQVKEWRSPPFCRNFQSGTRSLHAHRYHCCSRLCTNRSRVCTEHSARSKTTKDSTHITLQKRRLLHVQCYHYSNYSILCTERDPQLHTAHIKAKVHTDTNTHISTQRKKGAVCMHVHVITAIPSNEHSSMHKCVHCFKAQKAHHALSVHKRRPCRATSICYHRLSSFNLCTIHNVQLCTELWNNVHIYVSF